MDGIIVINKEQGYTSNDVVQVVKKVFHEKVGHTGTLDPIATGVLPILVGKGTLCSKHLIKHDKVYLAKVKLGIKTDTGDVTGNIIEKTNVTKNIFNKENVLKVLENLKGEQLQIPPMYSAIKINGRKLYEYAREGKQVDVEPRRINIYNTELIEIDSQNAEIQFRVFCSKGTYIRTLCEKFAELLKTLGTMSALEREAVGDFNIKNSITLRELKENFDNNQFIKNNFITIEDMFKDKEKIVLTQRAFVSFINGAKLFTDDVNGIYRIYDINGVFIGIGTVKDGILKRDIVIYK